METTGLTEETLTKTMASTVSHLEPVAPFLFEIRTGRPAVLGLREVVNSPDLGRWLRLSRDWLKNEADSDNDRESDQRH
jgi:hypothetical protein